MESNRPASPTVSLIKCPGGTPLTISLVKRVRVWESEGSSFTVGVLCTCKEAYGVNPGGASKMQKHWSQWSEILEGRMGVWRFIFCFFITKIKQ